MLKRIHHIKGIGLLHDADARALELKKASFIYADNGCGKSTLASILQSCATNDPNPLVNRRTINGTNEPQVHLQFSNGQQSIFRNGSWDRCHPELLVFDSDFVERNVYSGGQVTANHRKNLLNFALGADAVIAQNEYDTAEEDARIAAAALREITNQLKGIHVDLTLRQFQHIEEVPKVDDQITVLNEQLIEAKNIDAIQAKALPKLLDFPAIDVETIFQTLSTSIADIDLEAEQRVKMHIQEKNKPNLERWISDGYALDHDENCLYCNQSLDGVQLIHAYRSYFNHDYNKLKSAVSALSDLIQSISSDSIIDRLKASFSTASAIVDGWQEHVSIPPPVFDEASARTYIAELRTGLETLREAKEANLLEEVGSELSKQNVYDEWQKLFDIIEASNKSIQTSLEIISGYKEDLAAKNIEEQQQHIVNLQWAKIRYRQDVVDMFETLSRAKVRDSETKAIKQTKRETLNEIMRSTLERYKVRINELLRGFGAQFLIPNIDFNYQGGLSSDYALEMRGHNIALAGGVPDFKTCLSESDKRTLAFALFVASVESDPALNSRIVVIDDPMSSLDLNRKQQTRRVLKRIHDQCAQLIICAHDIHFTRSLRDVLIHSTQPNDVKCIRLKSVENRYSNFDDIDLDKECESAYFRCHRVLSDYLTGNTEHSLEVAKSIRPMLEGYLHRRFPGMIRRGLLFGEVIATINRADRTSPLTYAQNITGELNEINCFAGRFHHDTNPAVDQVEVVDGELRGFVERAIHVVHAGLI